MARTGRPPKPTVLKLLQGNPGKRKPNRREPKITTKGLTPPAWLGAIAKTEWRRLAKYLPKGLLTQGDRQVFAQYCQVVARLQEAERAIDQFGMTFLSENGYPCQRPEVAIAKNLHQLLRGLESDLGLNPSARSRISIEPPADKSDPTEDLLFGRRRGA